MADSQHDISATSSRRSLLKRAGKLAAGVAAGVGLASGASEAALAGAGRLTYVITNGANERYGPGTSYGVWYVQYCTGSQIYTFDVNGQYACSCNECTSIWSQRVNTLTELYYGYIHRGNLDPSYALGCQCP